MDGCGWVVDVGGRCGWMMGMVGWTVILYVKVMSMTNRNVLQFGAEKSSLHFCCQNSNFNEIPTIVP